MDLRFVMRLKKVRPCKAREKTAVMLLKGRCCLAGLREPAKEPRVGVPAGSFALTGENQESCAGLNPAGEAVRQAPTAALWPAQIYFPL